ncbi:hypothetical protein Tco_0954546 [Tanacetum coccineum]|uniref:Uncharacterized protein n=1 Tax=Tanacetum coccineum TaxID=301880 RepID=A0ABQ5E4N9_9ASTR
MPSPIGSRLGSLGLRSLDRVMVKSIDLPEFPLGLDCWSWLDKKPNETKHPIIRTCRQKSPWGSAWVLWPIKEDRKVFMALTINRNRSEDGNSDRNTMIPRTKDQNLLHLLPCWVPHVRWAVDGGGESLGGGLLSIKDEEVSLVDGVFEGALGALDLGNGSSSGGHECVWLLMMSEGDGELVLCIWREFMGRDLFENGMNLDKFREFQMLFKHSG